MHAVDDAPEQVIDMPARHDDEHRAIPGEARAEVVSEPRPRPVSDQLTVCLGPPLHRIVDDTEMQLHPVNSTINSDVAERALTPDKLNQIVIAYPARLTDARISECQLIARTQDRALKRKISTNTEIVAERRVDDLQIGVAPGHPGDEVLSGARFAELGRGLQGELGAPPGDKVFVESLEFERYLLHPRT